MTLLLSQIKEQAARRPAGYFEEVVAAGNMQGDLLFLDDLAASKLWLKYRREQMPSAAQSDWPLWAVIVAMFAGEDDAGIGDTLVREFGVPTGERFKRWHEAHFGLFTPPCGCAGKAAMWNELYSYKTARLTVVNAA